MQLSKLFKLHPIALSVALAVVLAAVAFLVLNSRSTGAEEVTARRGSLVEAVYGLGTVTSRSIFRARIGTSNAIEEVHVKEGDTVTKGQPLLRLQDGVSIRAPFHGTVTALPFHVGETVLPEASLLTLEDLDDLFVLATLEQQGALRVRPKMKVRLSFESLRSQTFDGEVRAVYPQQGQFLVDISVKKLPPQILTGMTADAAIQVADHRNALLVPERAVSGGKIIVHDGNKKRKIDVSIGISDGQWAEVLGGDLKEGDRILLAKP